MFNKETKYTDSLGKTNRIVEGTKIQGNIESVADFRLDGQLVGNFTSKGKLVLGPVGVIKGDVICKNADVEGAITGKIQIQELLNIKATAKINGEVSTGKLAVEPGAEFNATCTMSNSTRNTLLGEEKK
jgi:cytoskeletal protein CcmA (bactofilin family)|uniref:bactofilin family protein n=1 Tax=Flavobacterium sp. TaxID=239 RepID=UPI00404AF48E